MSHLNNHLDHPVKGARWLMPVEITPARLARRGWEGLLERNPQLTGWTAYDDVACIASFLKSEMVLTKAAALCGYAHPEGGGAFNLSERLLRHNSESLVEFARMLIQAGLLHKSAIKRGLEKVTGGPVSDAKKHVAKGIVVAAIKKYKDKKKAARQLGIDLHTLNFWLDD